MTHSRKTIRALIGAGASILALSTTTTAWADATAPCNVGPAFDTTECGVGSVASGPKATAVGDDAKATGGESTALGRNAQSTGDRSTALGESALASAFAATAVGRQSIANAIFSTAIGTGAFSGASGATALGSSASANGVNSTALGNNAIASGEKSTAIGVSSFASGERSISNGWNSNASGLRAIALGSSAFDIGGPAAGTNAAGIDAIAIGTGAQGTGISSVALGNVSKASGIQSVAVGDGANATGFGSTAVGFFTKASGVNANALGGAATGDFSVAVGSEAQAMSLDSIAFGHSALATGASSLALGSGSSDGGQGKVVSFGIVGEERRLINVAAGTSATDAVNLGQLSTAIAGIVAGVDPLAIHYDNVALTAITFNPGGAATTLSNVAAGIAPGDAVNKGQLDAVIVIANHGVTGAAAAQTTADMALGTATMAQTTADAAQANATAALTLGNALDSRVTTLEGMVINGGGLILAGMGTDSLRNGSNIANGNGAVALGQGQSATGNGAVAIGDPNTAAGTGAVAIGADNTAVGTGAVAIGNFTRAQGDGAVALGNGASALQAGSVALGTGTITTRANQVKLGGTGSSVTVGDIAASTAAQVGPTDIMTVDAGGTVGRDITIRPAIASLQTTQASQGSAISALQLGFGNVNGRLTSLESGQMALFDLANVNRDRADRGIAAAVAISDAPFPSAPGKTSYTSNVAMYRGQIAFSASAAHRLNTASPFAVTGAVSFAGKGNIAARVGVAGEF